MWFYHAPRPRSDAHTQTSVDYSLPLFPRRRGAIPSHSFGERIRKRQQPTASARLVDGATLGRWRSWFKPPSAPAISLITGGNRRASASRLPHAETLFQPHRPRACDKRALARRQVRKKSSHSRVLAAQLACRVISASSRAATTASSSSRFPLVPRRVATTSIVSSSRSRTSISRMG
jgi:hypothetical protein